MTRIHDAFAQLWALGAGTETNLPDVTITGVDPVLPSIYRVGEVAGATTAVAAAAAAEFHALRSGVRQSITVSANAAASVFRSERYMLVNDKPTPSLWGPLSGYYQTGDGRYVQIHANFEHHHDGVVALLGLPPGSKTTKDDIARALKDWTALSFEDAAVERGLCVGMLRSRAQWLAHPQGKAVGALPLLEITRIGDAPPEPMPPSERPLSGVRALDLTRIIAGPVCGRTLASYGAQVLRIGSPSLPFVPYLWMDVARGKRSAHLDLDAAADRDKLWALAASADIFSQGYRPGGLAARGFSPEALAEHRPGIIYVTLCAYSHAGPWAGRRGFDSLVQTVSGIGHAGAAAAGRDGTVPLPCQALDHATGFLAAYGAMVALHRRAVEGGSWQVRVSLAQTGHWLCGLGTVDAGLQHPDEALDDVAEQLIGFDTAEGRVQVTPAAEVMTKTPPHWKCPPALLGSDEPQWLP